MSNEKDPIEDLHRGQGFSKAAKVGYVTAFLTVAFIMGTKALAGALGYVPHSNYQGPVFGPGMGISEIASLLFSVSVMAPVLEELLFRQFLQGGLKKVVSKFWSRGAFGVAALASSLVFVALHETSDPLLFGLRLAGSLMLSWVFEKHGLAGSITHHAFYNGMWFAMAMAGLLFAPAGRAATLGIAAVGLAAAAASLRSMLGKERPANPVSGWALLAAAGLVFGPLVLWPAAMAVSLPLAFSLTLYALLRPYAGGGRQAVVPPEQAQAADAPVAVDSLRLLDARVTESRRTGNEDAASSRFLDSAINDMMPTDGGAPLVLGDIAPTQAVGQVAAILRQAGLDNGQTGAALRALAGQPQIDLRRLLHDGAAEPLAAMYRVATDVSQQTAIDMLSSVAAGPDPKSDAAALRELMVSLSVVSHDPHMSDALVSLSRRPDAAASATALHTLISAKARWGSSLYGDGIYLVFHLAKHHDPPTAVAAFLKLGPSLFKAGLPRDSPDSLLDMLSAAPDADQRADFWFHAGLSRLLGAAIKSMKAAGVSGSMSDHVIKGLMQMPDFRQAHRMLNQPAGLSPIAKAISSNDEQLDFEHLNFYLNLPEDLTRRLPYEAMAEILRADDYTRNLYSRSIRDINPGMFFRYQAAPDLIRIRYWLQTEQYDRIQQEQADPATIMRAILWNHQNAIISQNTELLLTYAGRDTVLKGMVPLRRKIGEVSFTKRDVARLWRALGLDPQIMPGALKEAGFRFWNVGSKILVIPAVFDLLLSAYRGSAENDNNQASYLTHSLTTALVHYATQGGEVKGGKIGPYGDDAFHEFDLGLLRLAGVNRRRVDRTVALAFSYAKPLPEYARKRTQILRSDTISGHIQQLVEWQTSERKAKQTLHAALQGIAAGSLSQLELEKAEEYIWNQLEILSARCGLKKAYFDAVFGCLDEAFFAGLRKEYVHGRDNSPLLRRLLRAGLRKSTIANIAARRDLSEQRVAHPWIETHKTLLDYLDQEDKIRKGTFEDAGPL
ncbi:MAG: CPBP family intramembrane metalloprotease [Elusimicrobia bacterium]|nr:CPBP family intramembrane metalloprotease [Elusimicrobiota bacterium]